MTEQTKVASFPDEHENAAPHIEYKAVAVTGFKVDDVDEGVITAIVSVTGLKDNVKDIIKPGAFEKSLATRTPKGVWHHNWHESISRTEAIKELQPGDPELPKTLPNGQPWPAEAGGLQVKTRFNLATQRGREAYEDVKFFGDQQEWSIGYNVPVGGATLDSKTGVRSINTMELYEYSPVLFGAMPAARTSSVKEAQLAYKALFDTETVEEKEEVVPEADAVTESLEIEELPEEEDLEEKALAGAKIPMSTAQASKLYKVMTQIMDLLRDAEVLPDEPEPEEEPMEEEPYDDDGENLVTLVEAAFDGNPSLMDAAEDFESAYQDEDDAAMQEAATPIMDAIEQAVEDGASPDDYADITDYFVEAFGGEEDSNAEEEAPEDEATVEDGSDMTPEDMEGPPRKIEKKEAVVFSQAEIDALLS